MGRVKNKRNKIWAKKINVLGTVDNAVADDKVALNILNYANGPGFYENLKIENNNVSRVNLVPML
jgi:hypothetical protein